MLKLILDHPGLTIGLVLAALSAVSAFAYLIARRVRSEQRYDRARDGASNRIDALARLISYADVTISRGECADERVAKLTAVRETFGRLAARKELFLEQGATVGEWNGLAAEAGQSLAELQGAWDEAKTEVYSAKLARQATAAAELRLSAFASPDGAEGCRVRRQMESARQLFAAKRWNECREVCKTIDPLIAVTEESAAVGKLICEAERRCSGCGQGKAIDAARQQAKRAMEKLETPADLARALAELKAARGRLEKLAGARGGSGKG